MRSVNHAWHKMATISRKFDEIRALLKPYGLDEEHQNLLKEVVGIFDLT